MSTQNIKSLDRLGYEAIHSSISQNIFYCRKNIAVEDNKKRMIIKKRLYTYIICDQSDSK